VALDAQIRATEELADLAESELILAVVPAQHLRGVLQHFAQHFRPGTPVVLCAKGIEQGALKLMNEVLAETPAAARAGVLSGRVSPPKWRADCPPPSPWPARRRTGARTGRDDRTPTFRPYVSGDMIGAEAGGAINNVLAIACGIVEGRGLGRSAHAALVTRGFAELTRLAVALGGRAETVAGLCGLGTWC